MKDFDFDNIKIKFNSITGSVIGSNKYSETHVSSSGGGGVVTQHGGYIAPQKISSNTTTHHEFWLETDNGTQVPIKLTGYDVPINVGQKITLISSGNDSTSHYVALVNHNAQRHWHLTNIIDVLYKCHPLHPIYVFVKAAFFSIILLFSLELVGEKMLPQLSFDDLPRTEKNLPKEINLKIFNDRLERIHENNSRKELQEKIRTYPPIVLFLFFTFAYLKKAPKVKGKLREHMDQCITEAYKY